MRNKVYQNSAQRLQSLSEAVASGSLFHLERLLNSLHPAEIAHFLESTPPARRPFLWKLVDSKKEGEVLLELGEEARAKLVELMESGELAESFKHLDVDDVADLLQSLPYGLLRGTLQNLDAEQRERVEAVLFYDEDCAGGMMDTRLVTLSADNPVLDVLHRLRKEDELPSHTDAFFVIDEDGYYVATLPLSKLLISQPDRRVADIMESDLPAISSQMSSREVAQLFEDRDYISAPVVDDNGILIGRITVDDVVDVIRDDSEHSLMSMAGLNEEEDLFAPVISSVKRRAMWLGANLITAFLAAWVIGQFTETIEAAVALAVLMGVVPSMGGIAGSQTLTLVIRGMALGQIAKSNTTALLGKELLLGVINGLLWALIVLLIAATLFDDMSIGVIVAIAMLLNLTVAPLAGVLLPIVLRKFGIDPALAGSVLLTTATDVVGYAAVLGLAYLLLPWIRLLLN